MLKLDVPAWNIALRTAAVYAVALVGLRLAGKREIGQMTVFDLVVLLLIANAVQNAMVGSDTSITGGLIVAATLLGINYVVSRTTTLIPVIRHVTEGEPILLVNNGHILTERLQRERIDLADLEQAAREHGVEDLTDVETAVLEVDGTVSIIPVAPSKVRTRRRVRQMRHP